MWFRFQCLVGGHGPVSWSKDYTVQFDGVRLVCSCVNCGRILGSFGYTMNVSAMQRYGYDLEGMILREKRSIERKNRVR